jgi:hypothetical protein
MGQLGITATTQVNCALQSGLEKRQVWPSSANLATNKLRKMGTENARCQTKITRKDTCAELCQLSRDSRNASLPKITSDETWLHYYDH